jgi:hypothetical protein
MYRHDFIECPILLVSSIDVEAAQPERQRLQVRSLLKLAGGRLAQHSSTVIAMRDLEC